MIPSFCQAQPKPKSKFVDDVLDAKEINDTQSALDLSYEVVTKLEHQEVDP